MKKSKGQRLREKIAKRVSLQEEDERLGRKAPALRTSLPPEERERRKERFKKSLGSSFQKLDGFAINGNAARGAGGRKRPL